MAYLEHPGVTAWVAARIFVARLALPLLRRGVLDPLRSWLHRWRSSGD